MSDWPSAMRMPSAEVRRRDLQAELTKSIEEEKRLRAELTKLEADAAALRESRSTMLIQHADQMARVRGDLTQACRKSTLIREKLRAEDLL